MVEERLVKGRVVEESKLKETVLFKRFVEKREGEKGVMVDASVDVDDICDVGIGVVLVV